jgi:Flp pilus assembly protein TadD
MRLRILFSLFCFVVSLALAGTAQTIQMGPLGPGMHGLPSGMSSDRGPTVMIGTCYGADGIPVNGVTVELRDPASNTVVASTTTQSNGSFELYNTPMGSYEVVARGQGEEARELIPAARINTRIDLHLARTAGNGGSDAVVSVVRLKIPQKARDRYNKAVQAYTRGKFDEADKSVSQSLAIYPENPEALTLRGLIAWRNQNTAAALEDLQQSVAVDPSYGPAYTAMSSIFNSEGKYDDAVRTTERAVAINPNAWQGYFEQAKALLGKGLYQKALQIANKAETLAPSGIAGVHLLKAYALVPLKLYKEAGTELQAFLSHAPRGQDISGVKVLLAKVQAAETAAASDPNATPGFALVNH